MVASLACNVTLDNGFCTFNCLYKVKKIVTFVFSLMVWFMGWYDLEEWWEQGSHCLWHMHVLDRCVHVLATCGQSLCMIWACCWNIWGEIIYHPFPFLFFQIILNYQHKLWCSLQLMNSQGLIHISNEKIYDPFADQCCSF